MSQRTRTRIELLAVAHRIIGEDLSPSLGAHADDDAWAADEELYRAALAYTEAYAEAEKDDKTTPVDRRPPVDHEMRALDRSLGILHRDG